MLAEIRFCKAQRAAQLEYWKHAQLIIDGVEGRSGLFSLEGLHGKRFPTRSRLVADEEWRRLQAGAICSGNGLPWGGWPDPDPKRH